MDAEEFVKALADESEKESRELRASHIDITAWTGTSFEPFVHSALVKPRVVFQRKAPGVRVRSRPTTSFTPPPAVLDKGSGVTPSAYSKGNCSAVAQVSGETPEPSRSLAERKRAQTPTGVSLSRSIHLGRSRKLSDLCRQSTEIKERPLRPRKSVHIPRAVAKSPINEFLAKTKLTVSEGSKPKYTVRKNDCTGLWVHAKTFSI